MDDPDPPLLTKYPGLKWLAGGTVLGLGVMELGSPFGHVVRDVADILGTAVIGLTILGWKGARDIEYGWPPLLIAEWQADKRERQARRAQRLAESEAYRAETRRIAENTRRREAEIAEMERRLNTK